MNELHDPLVSGLSMPASQGHGLSVHDIHSFIFVNPVNAMNDKGMGLNLTYTLTQITDEAQVSIFTFDTLATAAAYIRQHLEQQCGSYRVECNKPDGTKATVMTASVFSGHAVIDYDWREINLAGDAP